MIGSNSWYIKTLIWLLDRMLGIAKMNKLYQLHQMQGLSKEKFADRLIGLLELKITGIDELQQKIPKSGPVVIASNHPFGGIEGVILARAISEVRPDLKVLANKGLGIFKELKDYFIFTNPLSEKDPQNGPSLRHCIRHVESQKALLLFPAGRVSYYQQDKARISEHTWNKIVGRLSRIENCHYVPVYVDGQNSKWFYRLGRVYYRIRMLLLARELLNKKASHVGIHSGYPIKHTMLKNVEKESQAPLCRALSYVQSPSWNYTWPPDTSTQLKPIALACSPELIEKELTELPDNQLLVKTSKYNVYFAYQAQAPNIVNEIARRREIVFRDHNEGSGEPIDSDNFDASYVHLFIVRLSDKEIMGAYRIGLSDQLLQQSGMSGLYLSKMFKFAPNFVNQTEPCMEMGRSFLIQEFQASFQGLLLLWKGIGAFVMKYPQYKTLYGTVSISKLYHPKSVKLIESALIKESDRLGVEPIHSLPMTLHPELQDFSDSKNLTPYLKTMLNSLEKDGKDIPVLAKQYQKLGARFHALGIDTSFNHTPGLLLSVHLPSASPKQLKLYLGEHYEQYTKH